MKNKTEKKKRRIKQIRKKLGALERIIVPKLRRKIFEHGIISLKRLGELSLVETAFLFVDEYLSKKQKEISMARTSTNVFNSFFDNSLGLWVTSAIEKKDIEKKYNVRYMSNDERIAITKEAKRNIRDEKKKMTRKAVTEVFEKVHHGHSYQNELMKEYFGG